MNQINLDDQAAIIAQDELGVLKATKLLAKQCIQAWEETSQINIPDSYQNPDQVVVAGMGGSHLGAQLINAVFYDRIKAPLIIQNKYTIPGYVGKNTTVLATSFSGNTEEVLEFVTSSHRQGANIIIICSGGELLDFAKSHNLPYYSFESTYNPSRIPRYGSGYLFIAQMVFLTKLKVIEFTKVEFDAIIDVITDQTKKFDTDVSTLQNPAKLLAQKLVNHQAILVASDHLVGSAYIFKNQINESAKQFSTMFEIPELNHHLLEGLEHPSINHKALEFIFFKSNLYHPRVQARYTITQKIINQQKIATESFTPTTATSLTQAFETLVFTSFTALYLSILNGVNPGPNPWVDFLKNELKKSNL